MAKSVTNAVIDAALLEIADNCDKVVVCSAEPTTYTQANATYKLAEATLTKGTGVDYAIADGDTSGRKLVVSEQAGVSIATTGTATHVALIDTVNAVLKAVTTTTSQALTSGNTLTIPSFKAEIADPA